jgi:hypothetical protein
MPNDIEVMAAPRTISDKTRRVTIAGFLRVARGRMVPVPLGAQSCMAAMGRGRRSNFRSTLDVDFGL